MGCGEENKCTMELQIASLEKEIEKNEQAHEKTLEQLKLMFVTREECQNTHDALDIRLGKNDISFAEIKTKLNILLGILSAVGVAVLGVAVKMLFGG